MIDTKKYPFSVVQDIETLLKYFYPLEDQFQDKLEMRFNETHLIEIKDRDSSGFRFVVSTPHQEADLKTYCKVTKMPQNFTSIGESTFNIPIVDVGSHFNTWISLLKKYDSINLTKEDLYSKEEEKQFYDEFEIASGDSDIKALPLESQFKVYKLLEDLQERLSSQSESNPEVIEIIKDAEILKNNIGHLSQSVVAKGVAKIKVRIKKIGIKFFLDVVDVAYKEAIKFALRGGIGGIQQMLS